MFFHEGGVGVGELSGGCQAGDGPLFRQSCPAELSPRPQPGAWRRVSQSSFLSDAPTEMISHDL